MPLLHLCRGQEQNPACPPTPPQDLSDTASREMALERGLDRMLAEWAGVKFEVVPWKNTGGFRIGILVRWGLSLPLSC